MFMSARPTSRASRAPASWQTYPLEGQSAGGKHAAQPATAAAHEMRHQGEKDATRARAAATGAAASGPSACKFCSSCAATSLGAQMAGRRSAQEAQYAAGAAPTAKHSPSPPIPRGKWSVRCACSGKGRSGASSKSVDRQPCTASSCPRAKSAVAPSGEHAKQVVAGPGRGTKQQQQPRGRQVRQSREQSEQFVLRVTLAAQLVRDESLASKRGTVRGIPGG